MDNRITTRADVLWNGTHLFALMYKDSNASPSKLYKYRYDAGTTTYTLLPGFPVTLPLQGDPTSAKTAVLAQDSTGTLWVTYHTNDVGATTGKIHVIWSTSADQTVWNTTGLVLQEPVSPGDVANIVAFDHKIGVLWSNQAVAGTNFGFRVHVDGDPETTWQPVEIVAQGSGIANAHLSLAVTETQAPQPLCAHPRQWDLARADAHHAQWHTTHGGV